MPSRRRPENVAFVGPRRSWRMASAGPAAGRGASTATAPAGSDGRSGIPAMASVGRNSLALAKSSNEAGLALELAKRPEPRGEIDGRERHPAYRYRIADTLLADLEAAGDRVADIDSHIEEQSWSGEMS
jgi:hypothetical protein